MALLAHPAAPLRARPSHSSRPWFAPTVKTRLADILERLRIMKTSADAQAIIDPINKLAIDVQVASEVSTSEAAKDAQRAYDVSSIAAAGNAVSNGIPTPPPAV